MDNLNQANLETHLEQTLSKINCKNFLVAISGGPDSMLLLNMINQIQHKHSYNIRAIHINHNFSENSKDMESLCIDFCKNEGIELIIKNIYLSQMTNIEENLRNKRYESIFESMSSNETLLLGHHLDDQVETFLYRLFRGSSPIGLSAMKEITTWDHKIICRPFLSVSKDILLKLVKKYNVMFINDHTNDNIGIERNYIRKKIIPAINKKWPRLNKVMQHNILLQDTYRKIAIDYCEMIYEHIVTENKVNISALKKHPNYFYSTFIKYWIYKCLKYDLNKNELSNIMTLINNYNNDYPKCILKNNNSIIRYNNFLYTVPFDNKTRYFEKIWDLESDLSIGNYKLKVKKLKDKGIYENLLQIAPITVKPFEGNERIMLNKNNHQNLKKIFQNKSIPIWERDKFILLYSMNELLVAYGGDDHIFISSELR